MVVGTKMALQRGQSKGRISMLKIQNFTVQKRQSIAKAVYGVLMMVLAAVLVIIDPIELATNWYMELKEGSFLYKMWQKPSYQLISEVWIYNYTNVPEYLNGQSDVIKLEEVGPFRFQEVRTNENVTIDKERGVMTMIPKIVLNFLPEQSVANLSDLSVTVPNIALVAISTLAADKAGYFANAGAYYSLSALGAQLFKNLTAQEVLWGYEEPVVSLANNLFPGWIDFGKLGILDRFYAQRSEFVEVEIGNASKKFGLRTWNNSPGIPEQGFTDLNTSIPCNVIKDTYEGFMLSPHYPKGKNIPLFRKQACRIYPFDYYSELSSDAGFKYYRYRMPNSSFSKSSPYACPCSEHCLPEGFVDVNQCYYGFPIALSKPHFLDVDPVQQQFYEGMHPDPEKYASYIDMEPTVGAPIELKSQIQVNIAVRMSPGNPITKPLKDKVLPLMWLSLSCMQTPPEILTLLRLRLVIGPALVIAIEALLFSIGVLLGAQSFYRIWKPKYKIVETNPRSNDKFSEDRKSVVVNVAENTAFSGYAGPKELESLLTMEVEDGETADVISD